MGLEQVKIRLRVEVRYTSTSNRHNPSIISKQHAMDPFSIAVGVAGLLSLTGQTLTFIKPYVHDAKHGREIAEELLKELEILQYNLGRLDNLLRSDNEAIQQFNGTSVLVQSTTACRAKMTLLHDRLIKNRKDLLHILKWPFNVKEHRETIRDLRAFSQWIQFALTVDGCALLSKTSAEVLETFRLQLTSFQLLDQVGHQTQAMQQLVNDQHNTIETDRAEAEREKGLKWISTMRPEQKHHSIRMPRVKTTGEWLLERSEFRKWLESPTSPDNVLWCHGIQGSGKSVLAYDLFILPKSYSQVR